MTIPTPLQQLAKINRDTETAKGATEFARLAQHILAHDGKFSKAAIAAQRSSRDGNLGPRLAEIIRAGAGGISREALQQQKAAVVAGGLTGYSALVDYSQITNGFVNSLANFSCFQTMLPSMVPVPMVTGTVGAVSVGAQAFSVGEGSAKQISRISVTGQQMNPSKAHCIVVITQELARNPGANATALICRELQNSVAVTTDATFIAALIGGLTVFTSTGSTAEAVRADIANLLRSITTSAASRLYLIITALICKSWSMLTDSKGLSAFETLTPQGGSINGITVLVSDGVTAGNVVLVDASGIAAASGDVELNEYREGSVQLDTVTRLARERLNAISFAVADEPCGNCCRAVFLRRETAVRCGCRVLE